MLRLNNKRKLKNLERDNKLLHNELKQLKVEKNSLLVEVDKVVSNFEQLKERLEKQMDYNTKLCEKIGMKNDLVPKIEELFAKYNNLLEKNAKIVDDHKESEKEVIELRNLNKNLEIRYVKAIDKLTCVNEDLEFYQKLVKENNNKHMY